MRLCSKREVDLSTPRLDDSVQVVSAYEIRTGVQVLLDGKWRFLAMKSVDDSGQVTLRTYVRGKGSGGMADYSMDHTKELETRIAYSSDLAPPKRAKRKR